MHTYPCYYVLLTVEKGPCSHSHPDFLSRQIFARQSVACVDRYLYLFWAQLIGHIPIHPFHAPLAVETGPGGHPHQDFLSRQGFARQSFLRDYFPYTFNSRYRQIHIYAYIPASYSLCSRNGTRRPPASRPPIVARIRAGKFRARASRNATPWRGATTQMTKYGGGR